MLHSVKGDELLTFGCTAYNHLASCNPGRVKGMEGLTDFHEYEVGDIHHVVDGPQPYSQQFLLQPLGRGCYLDVGKGYAHIAGSTVMTDHLDGNGLSFTLAERGHVRKCQFSAQTVESQPCREVTGDSDMGGSVHPVGCQPYRKHSIRTQMQIFPGGSTYDGLGLKYHNTVMRCAYTQLVLRADHSEGLGSADLGFLDLDPGSVGCGQTGSDCSQQDFLTCRHIGCAAHYLQQFSVLRGTDFGDMEMIRVGMRSALHHLCYNNTLQTAWDILYSIDFLYFQTYESQNLGHSLGGEIERDILFQPII